MESLQAIIEILEESVKKNGADKVMTIGHLLNLLKLKLKNLEAAELEMDNEAPW